MADTLHIANNGFYKYLFCFGLLVITSSAAFSQQQPVGIFEGNSAIGTNVQAGSATYDIGTQEYTIAGFGRAADGYRDELHFVWKRIKGDFILYTRGRFTRNGAGKQRKFGWMARQSLEGDSPQVSAVLNERGLASLQYRKAPGDSAAEIFSRLANADVIQLQRTDSTYTMRVASFGEPFVTTQVTGINLGDEVYVGLFAGSGNENELGKALFWDVQLTIPIDEHLAVIRTDIGSNLEIADIETGKRTLINTDSNSTNSPILTKDAKNIIYSKQGLIYSFNLSTRKSQKIFTGDLKIRNSNDHVLSFDGKMIAFSNTQPELGGAIIYTLPVGGGIPKKITQRGPTYPHGWCPDGGCILFSGSHTGDFEIYTIPCDGGQETRLTHSKGIDDGPEYTPDGKHIYFNSNRTGTMLIWRMNADGTNPEPVTTGEFHDWFPHISPDGRWIICLSYSTEDVSPGGKPAYKQVYLRLIPVSGGRPRVIAYLYGGQGSINSPCWSPDSKKNCFYKLYGYSAIKVRG